MGYTQCQASRLAFLFLFQIGGGSEIAIASKLAPTVFQGDNKIQVRHGFLVGASLLAMQSPGSD